MLQLVFLHDSFYDSVKCSAGLCATVSSSAPPQPAAAAAAARQASQCLCHWMLAVIGWFYHPQLTWWQCLFFFFFLVPRSFCSVTLWENEEVLSDVCRHFSVSSLWNWKPCPGATYQTWPHTQVQVRATCLHTHRLADTEWLSDLLIEEEPFSTLCSWVQWRLMQPSRRLPWRSVRALYPVKVSLIWEWLGH